KSFHNLAEVEYFDNFGLAEVEYFDLAKVEHFGMVDYFDLAEVESDLIVENFVKE
ncbi:1900_t:CDS:1, partial [Gigaspora margarita]